MSSGSGSHHHHHHHSHNPHHNHTHGHHGHHRHHRHSRHRRVRSQSPMPVVGGIPVFNGLIALDQPMPPVPLVGSTAHPMNGLSNNPSSRSASPMLLRPAENFGGNPSTNRASLGGPGGSVLVSGRRLSIGSSKGLTSGRNVLTPTPSLGYGPTSHSGSGPASQTMSPVFAQNKASSGSGSGTVISTSASTGISNSHTTTSTTSTTTNNNNNNNIQHQQHHHHHQINLAHSNNNYNSNNNNNNNNIALAPSVRMMMASQPYSTAGPYLASASGAYPLVKTQPIITSVTPVTLPFAAGIHSNLSSPIKQELDNDSNSFRDISFSSGMRVASPSRLHAPSSEPVLAFAKPGHIHVVNVASEGAHNPSDVEFSRIQREIRERHLEIARRLQRGESLDLTGASSTDLGAIAVARAQLDMISTKGEKLASVPASSFVAVAAHSNNYRSVNQNAASPPSDISRNRFTSDPLSSPRIGEDMVVHNLKVQVAELHAALEAQQHHDQRIGTTGLSDTFGTLHSDARTRDEVLQREIERLKTEHEHALRKIRNEAEADATRKIEALHSEFRQEHDLRVAIEHEFDEFRSQLESWKHVAEEEEASRRGDFEALAEKIRSEAVVASEKRLREELERTRAELERSRGNEVSESLRIRIRVNELEKEIDTLRAQLATSRDRERLLQDENARLRHETEASAQLRDDALIRLQKERDRAVETERTINQELDKIRESSKESLQRERTTSTNEHRVLVEENREIKAALEAMRSRLDGSRNEIEVLKADLDREKSLRGVAQERTGFLAEEAERLRKAAQSSSSAMGELELIRGQLYQEKTRNSALNEKISFLAQESEKQREAMQRAEAAAAEVETLRRDIESLKERASSAATEAAMSTTRAETVERRVRAVESTRDELATELEREKERTAIASEKFRLAQSELDTLRKEFATFSGKDADIRKLQSALSEARQEVELARKDASRHSAKSEEANERARLAQDSVEALRVEVDKLRSTIREKQGSIEAMDADLRRLRAGGSDDLREEVTRRTRAEGELRSARAEISRLEIELENKIVADRNVATLKDQMVSKDAQIASLQHELVEQAQRLSSMGSSLVMTEVEPLQRKLREAYDRETALAAEVEALRRAQAIDLQQNQTKILELKRQLDDRMEKLEEYEAALRELQMEKDRLVELDKEKDKKREKERMEEAERQKQAEKAREARESEKSNEKEREIRPKERERESGTDGKSKDRESRDKEREKDSDAARETRSTSSKDKDDKEKSKEKEKDDKEKSKEKEKDDKEKSKEKEKDDKEKSKEKEKDDKEKSREKEKDDKEKSREKSDKEKREGRELKDKDNDREREERKDKEKRESRELRDKEVKSPISPSRDDKEARQDRRSGSKERRDDKDKDREREREREKDREKDREKEREKEKEKEKEKSRDKSDAGAAEMDEERKRRERRRKIQEEKQKQLDPLMIDLLKEGGTFEKWAEGKKKPRHVWVSSKLDWIYWRDPTKEKPSGGIKVADVKAVRPGFDKDDVSGNPSTATFLNISASDGQRLTLECKDESARDLWLNRFLTIVGTA